MGQRYIRFVAKVIDVELDEVLKHIVDQLINIDKVECMVNEFVEYAKSKGYSVEEVYDKDALKMISDNGLYYILITAFSTMEVNNETCIDREVDFLLSESWYSGK